MRLGYGRGYCTTFPLTIELNDVVAGEAEFGNVAKLGVEICEA